jgi:CDP-alcohol phosphatidyltransferase
MSKLSAQDKFIDLSDYGRTLGRLFAESLKNSIFTPVHVTFLFGIVGVFAMYSILQGWYILAGLSLILKSIIDAADGELARIKATPSYTGRYLDSVFDIILNFLFILAIWHVTNSNIWWALGAFLCIQLQGTLYNYYYVILRNKVVGGDTTSKVFEYKAPRAMPGEKQKYVDILFVLYSGFYGVFDKTIHFLDQNAYKVKTFPSWFMSLVSIYGLGFQLLIIAAMLNLGWIHLIIPFFVYFTIFIFALMGIRRIAFTTEKP